MSSAYTRAQRSPDRAGLPSRALLCRRHALLGRDHVPPGVHAGCSTTLQQAHQLEAIGTHGVLAVLGKARSEHELAILGAERATSNGCSSGGDGLMGLYDVNDLGPFTGVSLIPYRLLKLNVLTHFY